MKKCILCFVVGAALALAMIAIALDAMAQDGLLTSDTAAESSARHFEMRIQEQQAAPMGAAPLGGYTNEKFGDSAPAGTPNPGYAEPQGYSAPVFNNQ